MDKFPPIKENKKSGNEPFINNGQALAFSLLSFWKWAASDLVGNALRGTLAEFIVASATGSVEGVRKEWDAYDIMTSEGIKIEVKSSASIQSWSQKDYYSIRFDIEPKRGWNATTNEQSTVTKRQADVYTFCLLAHKNKETIDPLNLNHWEFYMITTETLNRLVGNQKSIG